MYKIIIDTDPGIDDAQAIAFALVHPQLELLGLTTVFGNATVDVTTSNALQILQTFGYPDIPVAAGASDPLRQPRRPSPDFVHGSDGLGNLHLAPPLGNPVEQHAAEFIVEQASRHPGEISLVAIGPLTNIALALQLDPGLPAKVRELVVMGGTVNAPGNVSPLAEANFISDPHAADQVLGRDWPLRIIGLDVTLQTLLTDHELAKIRDRAGAMGAFLWNSSRFYIDFYTSRLKARGNLPADYVPGCPMHDASAVVYLVAREAFGWCSGGARVVPDGMAVGQLAINRTGDVYPLLDWQDRPVVHAAVQVDAARVVRTFVNTLTY